MSDLRVLWVLDDGVRFTPDADLFTTASIMRACHRAGDVVQHVASVRHLGHDGAGVVALAAPFDPGMLDGGPIEPAGSPLRLHDVDIVFVRIDPPFTEVVRHSLALLTIHEDLGTTLFVNSPRATSYLTSKLLACRLEGAAGGCRVAGSPAAAARLLAEGAGRRWVAKPIERNSGAGVTLLDGDVPTAVAQACELIGEFGFIQLQPFCTDVAAVGEVRHLVVGDDVLVAWRKCPAPGDFRTNRDRGATVAPVGPDHDLGPARARIRALRHLGAGLVLYSIDLVGDVLIEVQAENVGGLPDADELYGVDHSALVVDRLRELVPSRSGRSRSRRGERTPVP